MTGKNVYIIAGPNGSGKTTYANEFLPNYVTCKYFVNADLIAKGLSPFAPEKVRIAAGKLALEQIEILSNKKVDFGYETTLSGKAHIKQFESLEKKGYKINLFFLWIPSSQLSIARIKYRVADGGHNVPSNDAKRRYDRSLANFFGYYKDYFENWMFFDNSKSSPHLLAQKIKGVISVFDNNLFDKLAKKYGVKK